jgi:hypothetical protein
LELIHAFQAAACQAFYASVGPVRDEAFNVQASGLLASELTKPNALDSSLDDESHGLFAFHREPSKARRKKNQDLRGGCALIY